MKFRELDPACCLETGGIAPSGVRKGEARRTLANKSFDDLLLLKRADSSRWQTGALLLSTFERVEENPALSYLVRNSGGSAGGAGLIANPFPLELGGQLGLARFLRG